MGVEFVLQVFGHVNMCPLIRSDKTIKNNKEANTAVSGVYTVHYNTWL